MNFYTTDEVYGIQRDIPLNYVEREEADQRLVENLTRKKHINIFGSSKQGKTSLRKKCLESYDYITVHCSNRWDLAELNANILKRAGFEVLQSTTKTTSGKVRISAKLIGKLSSIISGEVGVEGEAGRGTEKIFAPIDLDPEDVNDIITALESIRFKQFIVLEDFHYLKEDVQRDFAIELKAFHENSNICFIIIAVWLEDNRLIMYNGDLTGRIISIDTDKWTDESLENVIKIGESLMNIKFSEGFYESLIEKCNGNVYLVQESCYRLLRNNKIFNTQVDQNIININKENIEAVIMQIISEQTGRYRAFISNVAEGFHSTELEMYKWIIYAIITLKDSDQVKGIKYSEILSTIRTKHPKGINLNAGNLTQSLQSITELQIQKGIKPIIFDYDQSNLKLKLVDRGFKIWINNQDTMELLDVIGIN